MSIIKGLFIHEDDHEWGDASPIEALPRPPERPMTEAQLRARSKKRREKDREFAEKFRAALKKEGL